MKQVFWDTNVLLHILLRRDPFFAPAATLWLGTESEVTAEGTRPQDG